MTKADFNRVNDHGLYAPGQRYLHREDLLGRVIGTLPLLGVVHLLIYDMLQFTNSSLVVYGLFGKWLSFASCLLLG